MAEQTFLEQVVARSGQPVNLCYQCRKCTLGCPTVDDFDYPPNMVMRMIQLGMKDELLRSKAIWMCVSCETCGTRCPNGIKTAPVMDVLREMCLQEGIAPADQVTVDFHRAFTGSIRTFGRIHEATMLMQYKMKTRNFTTDVDVGLKLFLKGKIPILPKKSKNIKKIKEIFDKSGVK
ncbi:MAG: 4Fe-4S dicluster domain-containing protein [Deltaproteobacteria bacterium]|nr:4Fe-4S dicluster domain-containing protein [Candidatus Anaeroferrophillus wilburensis]MBN2890041.1 4Fe-4S dicluster domain-containing protein [Deltaproteobacteria bacterium]